MIQTSSASAKELEWAVANGEIPHGSVVIFFDSESAWLSWLIARIQKIALLDLGVSEDRAERVKHATHVGVVGRGSWIVEHYRPHTRRRVFEECKGTRLVFLTYADASLESLELVARNAENDVLNHARYDIGDLFSFYAYWRWKVFRKRKYHGLFNSRDRDVCSTRCVEWHNRAGVMEISPEAKWGWYPARFLVEPTLFSIIRAVEVV